VRRRTGRLRVGPLAQRLDEAAAQDLAPLAGLLGEAGVHQEARDVPDAGLPVERRRGRRARRLRGQDGVVHRGEVLERHVVGRAALPRGGVGEREPGRPARPAREHGGHGAEQHRGVRPRRSLRRGLEQLPGEALEDPRHGAEALRRVEAGLEREQAQHVLEEVEPRLPGGVPAAQGDDALEAREERPDLGVVAHEIAHVARDRRGARAGGGGARGGRRIGARPRRPGRRRRRGRCGRCGDVVGDEEEVAVVDLLRDADADDGLRPDVAEGDVAGRGEARVALEAAGEGLVRGTGSAPLEDDPRDGRGDERVPHGLRPRAARVGARAADEEAVGPRLDLDVRPVPRARGLEAGGHRLRAPVARRVEGDRAQEEGQRVEELRAGPGQRRRTGVHDRPAVGEAQRLLRSSLDLGQRGPPRAGRRSRPAPERSRSLFVRPSPPT
jgi:hypothetical protein